MSRIDDLVAEHCPDGVPNRRLGDIALCKTGEQLNRSSMVEQGEFPVFNGGVTHSGWTTKANCEGGTITVSQGGASAGFVNFVAAPFWVGAHCYTVKPLNAEISNRFLFHVLKRGQATLQAAKRGAGIPGLNRKELEAFSVPLPPNQVQEEIVSILDKFLNLEAELEAELEARRVQYLHFRKGLLAPSVGTPLPLGDFLDLRAGRFIQSREVVEVADDEHPYPVFGGGGCRGFGRSFSHDGTYALIGRQGALCGNVKRASGKFYATEHAVVAQPKSNDIDTSWVFHVLSQMNLNQYASKSAQPGLAVGALNKIEVPVPSLAEQHRLGAALDALLSLIEDHNSGLAGEILARRAQYEYYRDRLLTFDELAS